MSDEDLVAAIVDLHFRRLGPQGARLPEPLPAAMVAGVADEEGWVSWRPVSSPVTDTDLEALDEWLPAKIPPAMAAYFKHMCVLDTNHLMLPEVPSDNPLGPFTEQATAWQPLLQAGFIPFAQFGDGYGPVCLDTKQPSGGGDFAVGWIDHEEFHNLEESQWSNRKSLDRLFQPLFRSFRKLLEAIESDSLPIVR